MSGPEERDRARAWLEEQIEQLDGLRNASPRDPRFKQWRQNTLTVLQRIWPHEAYRSSRFRQISFTPGANKHAGQAARDWFTRGCAEANEYLRQLAEEVEIVGVVQPPTPKNEPTPAPVVGASDDGVPLIDFETKPAPETGRPPGYAMEDHVLDLGKPRGPEAKPVGGQKPPRLKVELRPLARPEADTHAPAPSIAAPKLTLPADSPIGAGEGAGAGAPASDSTLLLPGADAEPVDVPPGIEPTPPRPAAAAGPRRKTTRPRKPAPKGKLKDLLGLDHLDIAEVDSPPPPPAPPPPAPVAEVPARRPEPVKPEPVAETPARRPEPVKPEPVAEAPAPTPAPATEEDESAIPFDPEDFSRATADFLRNSPVLGLQGRPVQRATDVTQFMDPDAVAVATLAADLARLSVPDPERARLRATLLELSAQLDEGHPTWESVRLAVTESMAHAELARRLVPVLLPWFSRAA